MERRAKGVYGHRAPSRSRCIAMVSRDPCEHGLVSRLMREVGGGRLMTYGRAVDLAMNAPRERACLVVLADAEPKAGLEQVLVWVKRWSPDASVAVVGVPESPETEVVARAGGASYFVRPVAEEQWRALLEHALAETGQRTRTRQ